MIGSATYIYWVLQKGRSTVDCAAYCAHIGVQLQDFIRWKSNYSGLSVTQIRRALALDTENRQLRELIEHLAEQNYICSDYDRDQI